MARGVNKVILIGNCGAEPEIRTNHDSSITAMIKLATNKSWKDKATGEMQERTEWHRIKLFGRLAEVAEEYVTKGKQLYIEGELRTSKYVDKEGIERYTTEIIADELQLLGSAPNNDENRAAGAARAGSSGQANNKPAQNRPAARAAVASAPMPAVGDFDDDIPF